ncbi:dihydrofolate reductase [Paracoccus sp. (in: a-proteobacteria)]|uniref:dihydrofolate reductase n=1 Tax=Paracoccus sp. TaxID=267 RepID=UPI00289E1933|nr:dihydrofolate reductase [Paracoccus sp. (in: a-proteobacteria)]
MTLTLIVARDRNGAIGRDNDIPWFAPEDLASFQRETTGGALIMGRRTWESLPVKPLKSRLNCVISRDRTLTEHVFSSPFEAVDFAYASAYRRVYGIGGAEIYRSLLPVADRLLITEVDLAVEGADAFFPDFPAAQWRMIGRVELRAQDPGCVLTEYLRQN